ncbi:MAG: type II secretion system protein [Candidatus Omnitrophota bacterium]|nr:type II secretion system protein [Candidatus Omnitrophota bacterium]
MKRGLTMIELVLVIAIVAIVATALLEVFISGFALNENSRNMTIAANIAREKIEELINIKQSNWDQIVTKRYCPTDCIDGTLAGYGLNGSCRVDVINKDTNLKFIRVVVCWRLKNGRIVGTDNGEGGGTALNGVREGSEQGVTWENTPVLNSPVVVETALVNG